MERFCNKIIYVGLIVSIRRLLPSTMPNVLNGCQIGAMRRHLPTPHFVCLNKFLVQNFLLSLDNYAFLLYLLKISTYRVIKKKNFAIYNFKQIRETFCHSSCFFKNFYRSLLMFFTCFLSNSQHFWRQLVRPLS